jgi:hypothetical protein
LDYNWNSSIKNPFHLNNILIKNIIVKKLFSILTLLTVNYFVVNAQDTSSTKVYVENTFWGNRIVNGQSPELTSQGNLDVTISHRFGNLDQGFYEYFGLDQASMRLGFEYGMKEWLMIGYGRSTMEKTFDGFIKVKILKQSKGKKPMPITLTYFADMSYNSLKWDDPNKKDYTSSRIAYVHQLIIAKSIKDRLGIQVVPTLVHKNMVPTKEDKNDIFALGFGGNFKISDKYAITGEYYYLLPNQIKSQVNGKDVNNSLSVGLNIYTGYHVFQVFVTNSNFTVEKGFITQTTDKWTKGAIHIGFNIVRRFNIVHKKN